MIDLIDKDDVKKSSYKRLRCCACGKTVKKKYYDMLNNQGDTTGKVHCPNINCTIKANADWRNGNLDPSSPAGKGFIGQQIVAKTYGIEDCNLKMNSFGFYIDLKHPTYGYIEVKTRTINKRYNRWGINDIYREFDDILFDNLFAVCMDEYWPWKNVERVYAISWEVVCGKKGFYIYKDSFKSEWCEEFRIDEKPFNDTYHNMKLSNCSILSKDKLYEKIGMNKY